MDIIDDVFLKEIKLTLYHYTSLKGLLGIIKSKSIWSTSIYYLNDATEYIHACELMKSKIQAMQSTSSPAKKGFLHRLEIELFTVSRFNIFVCSFSEKGNLLSQWRGYCPDANGYSIGFSDSSLIDPILKQDYRLGKCIYDETEQNKLILMILEHVLGKFDAAVGSSPNEQEIEEWIEMFSRNLSILAPLLKNKAFEEECEWRLISMPIAIDRPEIRYREGKTLIIPYHEFQLVDNDSPLRIEQIYIGPSTNYEKAATSLDVFLKSEDVLCKAITPSKIPYRGL